MKKTAEEIIELAGSPPQAMRTRIVRHWDTDEERKVMSSREVEVPAGYAYCLTPIHGGASKHWRNADIGMGSDPTEQLPATHFAWKIGLDKDEPYSKGGPWEVRP